MSEQENVVETTETPNRPEKEGFKAKAKEWLRKKIVALKRNPQRIPLIWQAIVSFFFLIVLNTFSKSAFNMSVAWTGLLLFVNTLISILILALFLNAFPKRKPANKIFIGLLFVFIAGIITCDILYYVMINEQVPTLAESFLQQFPVRQSLTLAIVHIVLEGISALLLATLPLYAKLIRMINTRKEVNSTELKEEIDTSEEV